MLASTIGRVRRVRDRARTGRRSWWRCSARRSTRAASQRLAVGARRGRRRGRAARLARAARRRRAVAAGRAARGRRDRRRVARSARRGRRAGARAPRSRWIAASLTARGLAAEIAESTDRMGKLVKAIKAYAFMDRGELVETDIHEGLETTLLVLGHKLKHTSIEVRRDYDRSLPKLTLRGSELNQVWTNLLANAIEALGDSGTIEIVTARDGVCARVDIIDDGPGIPADDPRPGVRPVLHDQGRRRGHGPRARHRAPDRHRAPRRLDRVRVAPRADRVPHLAAARRRHVASSSGLTRRASSRRHPDGNGGVRATVPQHRPNITAVS